ncbi:MAG: hypothetical protein AAGB34_06645, partial [Planctomycetota bacterium]
HRNARAGHAEDLIEARLQERISLNDLRVNPSDPPREPYTLTHLVLYDYLLESNIEQAVICPSDDYLQGLYDQFHDSPDPRERARSFLSSYIVPPATFLDDLNPGLRPAADGLPLGWYAMRMENYAVDRWHREVRHPSAKVWSFEPFQMHFGEKVIYGLPEVRQPLLMFDGSVSVRNSGDSELGYDPGVDIYNYAPTRVFDGTFFYYYTPDDVVVRNPFGLGGDTVFLRYYWTRNGLRGHDF